MFFGSLLNNKYNGFIRLHRNYILAFVKVSDIILIALSFSWNFSLESAIDKNELIALILSILTFEFFATINGLYSIPRGARFLFIIKNIISSWAAVSFMVLMALVLDRVPDYYDKFLIISWLTFTPFLLVIWHFLIRIVLLSLRRVGRNTRTAAIVGANLLGLDIANIITKQAWMGYSLLGFFDDRKPGNDQRVANVNLIGDFECLINMAKRNELEVIFITLPMRSEQRIKSILDKLSDTSVVVYFIPDLFVFDLMGARVDNFNGMPAVCVYDIPHSGFDGFSKRLFDIVFSIIILAIIAVPMLLIAIGVKLSSPGPVFFKQRRYGFKGQEIRVWKFRTMTVCEDGDHIQQARQGDSRITPFGQFLRKNSLDELPQFFNTLMGSMSIVGPRPHAVMHNEYYREQIKGYMLRHNVKPGITGLAQIKGFRGETATLDKMESRIHADLEYIQNWSIWLDLEILCLTCFLGFKNQNAY